LKAKHKILAWLGILLFVGVFTAYAFEFQWIENTFDAAELIWKSIVAGVLAGLSLGWYLRKKAGDLVGQIRLWSACLLLAAFFAPLLGSLTNRLFSPYPVQMQPYELWEEKPYAAELYGFLEGEKIEPDGYYIFIVTNGTIKRFDSKIQRFKDMQRGQIVELPIKKGLWGFEFVKWE
jgi:hypothetical protein